MCGRIVTMWLRTRSRLRWETFLRGPEVQEPRPASEDGGRGPDGRRGRLGLSSSEWARRNRPLVDDDEPSRDWDPVPRELLPLLPDRRRARPPDAIRAGVPRPDDRRSRGVQRAVHDARDDDDLPRFNPDPRGLREPDGPAPDRGEGHGLPADQRAQLLDNPRRGSHHVARGGEHRMDGLYAAQCVRPEPRGRHVDRRPPTPGDLLDRGRGQLPRDDLPPPGAWDHVPESLPLRLVDPRHPGARPPRHPGPRGRTV